MVQRLEHWATTYQVVGSKSAHAYVSGICFPLADVFPPSPALKGIHMSGIKVIAITDNTTIATNAPRPRKMRRL
ncbi:hypothetical protein LSH36_352g00008 [Paralvinella palmiformis]|uniref:Uncharacterized protein n=1 Tax=Paralvinella palmiformis TaxID=53620 RepID=A0AAD9JFM8_9ANNE|nr:hypothetical protein LSH36_352g00008 [Paralvinella palmiformis]